MSTFRQRVEKNIHDFKYPGDFNSIPRIPVFKKGNPFVFLRPIPAHLDGQAAHDAMLMAKWRNMHKENFFTWITATEASTKQWLENTYSKSLSDVIFMIETENSEPFAHIALYNFDWSSRSCEFGRVLRGIKGIAPGGILLASRALIRYAFDALKVRTIILEVFENNLQAVALYQRCGFKKQCRIPLIRVKDSGMIKWQKANSTNKADGNADGYAINMKIERM